MARCSQPAKALEGGPLLRKECCVGRARANNDSAADIRSRGRSVTQVDFELSQLQSTTVHLSNNKVTAKHHPLRGMRGSRLIGGHQRLAVVTTLRTPTGVGLPPGRRNWLRMTPAESRGCTGRDTSCRRGCSVTKLPGGEVRDVIAREEVIEVTAENSSV